MKTHILIIAIIISFFSFTGCQTNRNFDYKITLAPELNDPLITPNEMYTAAKIISKRLSNSTGILPENLESDVTGNQISFNLSKVDTSQIPMIRKLITDNSRLEFWETYENSEIMEYLSKANDLLKGRADAVRNSADSSDEFTAQNPLLGILKPMVNGQGEPLPSCLIGLALEKDTALVNLYLQMPEIRELLPRDLKLIWSRKPYRYYSTDTLFELHAIRITTEDEKAPLDGSVILSASPVAGSSGSDLRIRLTMNPEGASKWANITKSNINRCIAVVVDGYVRSYPRVMNEISGGSTEISGDFSAEEAIELASILKSGVLPFDLKIVKDQLIKRE